MAFGTSRTSTNYVIQTDTVDSGGNKATSTDYTMNDSINDIGGISAAVSPPATVNSGYVGQLYQVVGLVVLVGPIPSPDPGTRQLNATATLDDSTVLVLSGSQVGWSSPDEPYPIASISTGGLVTPTLSLEADTTALVDGYYFGGTGVLTLSLAPLNSVGDGIPDWWRATYFPPGNGSTTNDLDCATCDADGTGQDNLLKFLAGLDPTNSVSVLKITSVARQSNDVLVTWTSMGGHSYVLQSTRSTAMIAGFNTNFADASPLVAVSLAGASTTNYLDLGAAYAPVLTSPGGQMSTTSTVPSTVDCSAIWTRGLVDSLGQALPIGSLLMLGTFNVSEATIQSNFLAGNLTAIMSAFTPHTDAFAVGDGTDQPASWDVEECGPGFGGQQIYLVAVDAPTLAVANHLGIFTAPSWIFPDDGNEIAIDLEDVTDFVIGAQGGPLTLNLALGGETYTFTDTARLSVLPGRMLFYRVRLGP